MVAMRAPFVEFAGDRAPYALNFLAVVIAAVLAGWRSGLVALLVGQTLIWYAIVPPYFSFAIGDRERFGGFVIATLSQLLLLMVITLYQREVDKGTAEREERLTLLDEALSEIDHRTRNNYQVVLALIELQARRSESEDVRKALRQVGERIQAIADASQQLAVRSADIGAVRLDDHLCGLVERIERGISRKEIDVECDVDDVTTTPDKATSISIIVNELVTNAIKHAFNGERSGHVRVTGKCGKEFELVVSDDGCGFESKRRSSDSGLGTKLVESFARQLGAKHQVSSSEKGTMHRILIPSLD